MGLFYNYNKPGKGISREEAEKRNYFDILGRKFTMIIKANLLFFGTNIILFALMFLFFSPVFLNVGSQLSDDLISHWSLVLKGQQLMSPVPFVLLALFAPTVAGLTYLCRNFAKQEHVFLVSDFFEHTKKNFLQSLLAGFILSALLYLYITAYIYYLNTGMTVLTAILTVAGIILAMASFYVFPLIVTFKLRLSAVFKNALLFSVINLPQNMLVLVFLAALHIVLIYNLPRVWLILMAPFLIAFSSYTMNFVVWNVVSKHIDKDESVQPEQLQ